MKEAKRRKKMKPFSVIGLKFLDKNGKLSKNTYEYLMTEELSNKFYSTYKDSIGDNIYLILNENDYNYRNNRINSRVVVHYWHKAKAKYEFYPELLYLNDFYEAIPLEIKSRCYDGSTPFDEKEKDMDLEKRIDKICINNETYNLSDNLTNAQKAASELEEVKEKRNRKESKKMFENIMKNLVLLNFEY